MSLNRFLLFGLRLITAAGLTVMPGCVRPEQPRVEEPPPPQEKLAKAENLEPKPASELPAPTPGDIQEAVARVFDDAASIETGRNPHSVFGDFNGDGSEDIAVILKPVPGKLNQMNREYPKWIAREPLSKVLPRPVVMTGGLDAMPLIRISKNELLLAVIHGYGANGWRDSEATQTFLLKEVVGRSMTSRARSDILAAHKGRTLPRLHGDVIQQVLLGQSGFLYYSGASYDWYDPKHYKPEDPGRLMHPGMGAR